MYRPDPLQAALQSAEVDRLGDTFTEVERDVGGEVGGEGLGLHLLQNRHIEANIANKIGFYTKALEKKIVNKTKC